MSILRLAFRNVLRQRRRSALTVVAIVLSLSMFLVLRGVGDGVHQQMAEIGVRMGLGDVVIYRKGYRRDPSLDHLVQGADKVRAVAAGLGGAVEGVAVRLRADGLTQAGGTSVGSSVWGVDPTTEGRLSKVGSPASIVDGAALDAGDAQPPANQLAPIVIGRAMAAELAAHVDDRVTVTLQPAGGGAMRSAAFRVKGIYATGVRDVDGGVVLIPLSVAQRLAGAPGAATMVAVLLRAIDESPRISAELTARLQRPDLEALPWQEAAPELYATIALDQGALYLMMVVVYIVVAAGILNTILLSVLERTRELGVLLALGAEPGRLVRLVLAEAAILGSVAVAVGTGLGLAAHHHLATAGVELPMTRGLEASGVLMPTHFYSRLTPETVAVNAVIVLVLVLLSALYPAWRAARLQPVEAIHHG
jgi:lipoprotein-releasing system permease protein